MDVAKLLPSRKGNSQNLFRRPKYYVYYILLYIIIMFKLNPKTSDIWKYNHEIRKIIANSRTKKQKKHRKVTIVPL